MKVFVTGGAGFVGSWLVESLLSDGHEVVSVDNFIGGYTDNVVKDDRHTFITADVRDFKAMEEHMQGCDVVVHTAALAYEGLSVFSPALITDNIVSGTTVLASAAINAGVKRFVNCSSMARYGANQVPFTESMPATPEDPYGVAKVAAEMQLNLLAKIHKFDVVHAVPHNIIGPRQKYDDPFRNVVSIMANLMLQGRQPIVYGDGEQKRCFSFIQDDLFVMKKLIDCDLVENGECFNVGPDEEFVTINELAHMIAGMLDFDLDINYQPDRPCEVKLATCSANKIRERFGYETKVTLKEGVYSIIDYVRERGTLPFEYHLDLEIVNDQTPRAWKDRLF